MDRQIPIYFDNAIIASPLEKISESNPNIGRLKVGVFTKYGNRNGSYITDVVAEQLIASATVGDTPVVGFFDPETKTWAGHTGPTLANSYGYVEGFEGWKPLQDTDGTTRDYAIFSVVLFTKYFEEATMIAGQNQSMELDINSIDGDWADIEGIEYFVYKTARIQGLCIIGSHEPCFSVSSFFSKNDDQYKNQYEKFAMLLADLKAQIANGGETTMDNFEQEITVVEEPITENMEPEIAEDPAVEALAQQQYDELQHNFEELQIQYAAAQARISELEAAQEAVNTELENLREQNSELQSTVTSYEAQATEHENERKNALIEKYEKEIDDPEEITKLREAVSDFTYEALEGKLAILFANKKMADIEEKKVPLDLPQQESEFALLMKKYRK